MTDRHSEHEDTAAQVDPIVAEVRAQREAIVAAAGGDPGESTLSSSCLSSENARRDARYSHLRQFRNQRQPRNRRRRGGLPNKRLNAAAGTGRMPSRHGLNLAPAAR
jgi:hypothetical protein